MTVIRANIYARSTWHARLARGRTRQDLRNPITLVVHHTAGRSPAATLEAERAEMRELQRQHMDNNGWVDVGYNLVIMPSGRIHEGRPLDTVGAHTKDRNTGTIGVSFAGNYDTRKTTRAQVVAFDALLERLVVEKRINIVDVRGHREMPGQSTACPGRYLMPHVRAARKHLRTLRRRKAAA